MDMGDVAGATGTTGARKRKHTEDNDHEVAEAQEARGGGRVVAEARGADDGVGGLDMAILGGRLAGARLGGRRGQLLLVLLLLLVELVLCLLVLLVGGRGGPALPGGRGGRGRDAGGRGVGHGIVRSGDARETTRQPDMRRGWFGRGVEEVGVARAAGRRQRRWTMKKRRAVDERRKKWEDKRKRKKKKKVGGGKRELEERQGSKSWRRLLSGEAR